MPILPIIIADLQWRVFWKGLFIHLQIKETFDPDDVKNLKRNIKFMTLDELNKFTLLKVRYATIYFIMIYTFLYVLYFETRVAVFYQVFYTPLFPYIYIAYFKSLSGI
jgi:hypothetical protein